jgi:hypothetical protein
MAFGHEKLDVCRVSIENVCWTHLSSERLSVTHRYVSGQRASRLDYWLLLPNR